MPKVGRKRRFRGVAKQFLKKPGKDEQRKLEPVEKKLEATPGPSTVGSKLTSISTLPNSEGNRIVDFELLQTTLSSAHICDGGEYIFLFVTFYFMIDWVTFLFKQAHTGPQ